MTKTIETSTAIARFEITGWDVQEAEAEKEAVEGAALGRAIVSKRFSGAIEGSSVAHLLTAVAAGGRGYVAIERVEGALEGRRGSFVIQHSGIEEDGLVTTFGTVVPDSGTGELAGLHGEARYRHEGDVAQLTLSYSLGG